MRKRLVASSCLGAIPQGSPMDKTPDLKEHSRADNRHQALEMHSRANPTDETHLGRRLSSTRMSISVKSPRTYYPGDALHVSLRISLVRR